MVPNGEGFGRSGCIQRIEPVGRSTDGTDAEPDQASLVSRYPELGTGQDEVPTERVSLLENH